MSDRKLRQRPRVKSPAPGDSSTQARPKPLSPSQPKSRNRISSSISPAKDVIPSHYFTPRKAFSQEVASSPLISDLEMDALTAECGDIMKAVESMTSEDEASPVKMGPPSTQKYHSVETPNTKKDRELRQMLMQDLECSESERDTPFKSDTPRRHPATSQTAITPEASTSIQSEEDEVSKSTKVAAAPGLVAKKSMSTVQPSSSSEDDDSPEEKSEESSGDELDIYSSNFNPQLALRMGRRFFQKLPHPMTKKLKSLEQYSRVAAKAAVDDDFEKHMMRALKHKKRKEKEVTKRNFLPEQGPVAGTYWTQQTKNLVDRMENFTGPMAKLKEYREKKIRIMVKTRNIYSGTNDMVAYVAAFDKHWNMALTDVEETFLRKLRRKTPIQMGQTVKVSEEELEKRGLVRPKVIKKVGAKFELCKRYIPQLMIRGEQIVIVYPVV